MKAHLKINIMVHPDEDGTTQSTHLGYVINLENTARPIDLVEAVQEIVKRAMLPLLMPGDLEHKASKENGDASVRREMPQV